MRPDQASLQDVARSYAEAWCSKSPEAVAAFYAADGQICVNRGEPVKGRAALAEMAAGFYADLPDMVVICDEVRGAGSHAIFAWTFEGHHAETKNFVRVRGWEEWELDGDLKIRASLGWYDADDYARQIAEGFREEP